MAEYHVILFDADGFETTNEIVEGLSQAKKTAKYLLSADYAISVESTHEVLGTFKVEIRNADGDCVWIGESEP